MNWHSAKEDKCASLMLNQYTVVLAIEERRTGPGDCIGGGHRPGGTTVRKRAITSMVSPFFRCTLT